MIDQTKGEIVEKLEIDVNDIINSLTRQNGELSKDKAMLEAQVTALMKLLGGEAEGVPQESKKDKG